MLLNAAKGAVFGVGLACAASASAQLASVPSGSPLDQSQSSSTSSSSSQSSNSSSSSSESSSSSDNPYSGDRSFGALNVNDPNSITSLTLDRLLSADSTSSIDSGNVVKQPAKPGEFQKYMELRLGREIPLYGAKLVLPALRDFAAPATATVPPDYVVQPGDAIDIAMSGSLSGSVSRNVDTNGMIFLTGVGSVRVAGVHNSDLQRVVARAIGTKFRGFNVSVTITKLRGIRVYVTGFANNPGAFTVSSLSTLANAVFQAGGPNSGGSWRDIKLYRNGHEVANFDLYQLMRGGSRVNDVPLQNEDVLFIPSAGPQVAVIGSVNEEAIYEAKPGESVAAMLAAAGGPNTIGDPTRFVIYHSDDADRAGPQQMPIELATSTPVAPGDIIQMLSTGTLSMPTSNQKVLVRVEGEVRKPGIYYVAPGARSADLITMAGGLTSEAFPFGTRFTRQAVQIQQQQSYKEALNQLEISIASSPLSQDPTLNAGDRTAQMAAARAVITQLRQAKPDGRVVLDIAPDAQTLPGDVMLENNDTFYIPHKASAIGVFGAVYRPSSFLVDGHEHALRVRDYIENAGGTLRSADRGGIFVVRANGAVISKRRGALNERVLPGDVIFVPVRTQPNLFWAKLRDITTTLFSFGISAATIVAVTK